MSRKSELVVRSRDVGTEVLKLEAIGWVMGLRKKIPIEEQEQSRNPIPLKHLLHCFTIKPVS